VAIEHGWDVRLTEDATLGGARFEVGGVDTVERTAEK
jgi:hypothetical protein